MEAWKVRRSDPSMGSAQLHNCMHNPENVAYLCLLRLASSPEKEKEKDHRSNSNILLLERRSVTAEVDRSLNNDNSSRPKNNHSCQNFHKKGNKKGDWQDQITSDSSSSSTESDSSRGDFFKANCLKGECSTKVNNIEPLASGHVKRVVQQKEKETGVSGEAEMICSNIVVDLTRAQADMVQTSLGEQGETQSDDKEEASLKEDFIAVGVKTPVKTTKQRKGEMKVVAIKSHIMRMRNSKEAE
ncbi:hypothetical protein LWI28_020562 [Acer negundo]|uniref:Uncharacterized protein n=1 Tax=Acer negundo TaxID=4023 RepID=A0AAD5P2N8_ACENE|nr:hypothetical protein LWI28_020562 [Acer negundo]KAK4854878.1 hypothetical protein QYF36_002120 [Acer negundo]